MSIEEKYGIVYDKNKRYYICDLQKHNWDLDDTVPYMLSIDGHKIYKNAWNRLIVSMVEYLDSIQPKTKDEFLALKNNWNGQSIFSTKKLCNFTEFKDIYVHTNNNAHRSMLTVQILLDFYNVDLSKCEMLIRRHFSVEPKEVRKEIETRTKNDFFAFYEYIGFSDFRINKLLDNIGQLNDVLKRSSPNFDNFYLFDDLGQYSNYKNVMLDYLEEHFPQTKKGAEKTLEYLSFFYRHRKYFNDFESLTIDGVTYTVAGLSGELIDEAIKINNVADCNELHKKLKKYDIFHFINPEDVYEATRLIWGNKYIYEWPYIKK